MNIWKDISPQIDYLSNLCLYVSGSSWINCSSCKVRGLQQTLTRSFEEHLKDFQEMFVCFEKVWFSIWAVVRWKDIEKEKQLVIPFLDIYPS